MATGRRPGTVEVVNRTMRRRKGSADGMDGGTGRDTVSPEEPQERQIVGYGGGTEQAQSAPHEFSQETGTPAFSKGPHRPEERASAHGLSEAERLQRGSAEPPRRETGS